MSLLGVLELSYSAPFATEGTGTLASPPLSEDLCQAVWAQWGVTQRTGKELLQCHFVSPFSNCPSLLFLYCENHNALSISALPEFPVWLAPPAAFLYTPSSALPHQLKG